MEEYCEKIINYVGCIKDYYMDVNLLEKIKIIIIRIIGE